VLTSLSISDRLSVNAPGYVVAWTGADGLRTLPGIVGRIAAISWSPWGVVKASRRWQDYATIVIGVLPSPRRPGWCCKGRSF